MAGYQHETRAIPPAEFDRCALFNPGGRPFNTHMVFALYAGIYFFGLFLSRWHRSAMAALRTGAAVTVAALMAGLTLALLLRQEMLDAMLFAAFIALTGLPALGLGLGLLAGGVLRLPGTAQGPARWCALGLAAIVPLVLAVLWTSATWNNFQDAQDLGAAQIQTPSGRLAPMT